MIKVIKMFFFRQSVEKLYILALITLIFLIWSKINLFYILLKKLYENMKYAFFRPSKEWSRPRLPSVMSHRCCVHNPGHNNTPSNNHNYRYSLRFSIRFQCCKKKERWLLLIFFLNEKLHFYIYMMLNTKKKYAS